MNLTFPAVLRARFPQPENLSLQSFYFFNMYRAGSSVVEAAAEALAHVSGRTANNVTQTLYDAGVEFFDTADYSRSAVYLADDGAPLLRLCEVGGYVNYGFREVPTGFAAGFSQIGAGILIVRDPRDIGISHYTAVHQHTMEDGRVAGPQIARLREIAGAVPLEDYILRADTLAFLNRIATCYAAMIARGIVVLRYEDLYRDGAFSLELLCDRVFDHFAPLGGAGWSRQWFGDQTAQRIANSKALKGHATSGGTGAWRRLPPDVRARYDAGLAPALALLGYA